MKPVFQRYGTDETRNEFGDCLRACVASLMELSLDEVPHFRWGLYEDDDGKPGDAGNMWGHLTMWLRARNLGLLVYNVKVETLDEALAWTMKHNAESYLVLGGTGWGGQGHVVIAHKGRVVHDPSWPDSAGYPDGTPSLSGPLPTGEFTILALEYRPPVQRDNVGLLGIGSLDDVEIPRAPDCSILDPHERIGLAFSGGKDSLAVLKLLEPHWSRLRIYHVDTQDLLPETKDVVVHAYAMTKGKVAGWQTILTNSIGWQDKFGMASDLVSHDCTDMGQASLHGAAGSMHLVPRMTCCAANLSQPVVSVMAEHGITLVIRGTRREDSAYGWMSMAKPTGPDTFQDGTTTYWLPIHDWSTAQVFAYLKREGLPIARYYQGEYRHSGPECSRCTAWLDEGRGPYLRKHHPALAGEYLLRLVRVRSAILPTLQQLDAEIAALTMPIT